MIQKPSSPKELKSYLETLKGCKSVEVIEYLEHPAMVIVVQLTFWYSLYALLFGARVGDNYKLIVQETIPQGIEHTTLIVF